MFKPRKWIIAISLLYTAQAIAQPAEPRYTYLEAGYVDIDLNDVDADGDGFALGGSLALGDAFYLAGSYADYDLNFGIDAQELLLGVGYHYGLSSGLDLVAEGGYAHTEIDTQFGDFDDSGLYLSGGLRWMALERLELNGRVRYVDLDDSGDGTALLLGGLFHVTPDLALGGGVELSDDSDVYNIGFRLYLGAR